MYRYSDNEGLGAQEDVENVISVLPKFQNAALILGFIYYRFDLGYALVNIIIRDIIVNKIQISVNN